MSDTLIPEGTSLSPPETLRRLMTSYVVSQALYVAAKLGIADLLAEGPRSADELASAASVHARSLFRVLRLLTGVGVFARSGDREFTLNELGECLRTGVPGSVRSAAMLFGEEPYRASGDLLHTVCTGQTAFEHVFGVSHYEYLASHPGPAETFHHGICQLTGVVHESLLAAYDFSTAGTLVDVGGGQGLLIASILAAHPSVRGILFDTRSALAEAERLMLAERLAERCDIVQGDFFDSVPGRGDTYLLKSVIHNWNDDRAVRILRNCSRAMAPVSKLLLIERLIADENGASFFPQVNDVIMMIVAGGAERTETEYRALCAAADLCVTALMPTTSGFSILECAPRLPAADSTAD